MMVAPVGIAPRVTSLVWLAWVGIQETMMHTAGSDKEPHVVSWDGPDTDLVHFKRPRIAGDSDTGQFFGWLMVVVCEAASWAVIARMRAGTSDPHDSGNGRPNITVDQRKWTKNW